MRQRSKLPRRWIGAATGAVMVAGLIAVPAFPAHAEAGPAFAARTEKSISGSTAVAEKLPPDPAEAAEVRQVPAVSWPKQGSAVVSAGTRLDVAGMPVRVGRASTAQVRVEVLDKRLDGPLFRLARTDVGAAEAGKVPVEVDYSRFRGAYGGDWALRLRLVELPECALKTPEAQECQGTMIPTRNNGTGTLSADVLLPGAGAGQLYGLVAFASSAGGDFGASQLGASSTWQVGGSSGDFSWAYPMEVPPSLEGPSPQLNISYSSGGVDGSTSASNNQPSWVGEGFDFAPGGFIERRYVSCGMDQKAVDGKTPNNAKRKTGDQCWGTENATFALNGKGGELIRDDATGVWRPRADDGSKVERINDAATGNGARNGEYWKITSRDGTQYFFGRNRLPGWVDPNPQTRSTLTVPVYGNHPGEPCYETAFDSSYCAQAWRWYLDYVVDTNGNTMSLFYTPENNNYARNMTTTKVSTYQRAAQLNRIEYGQRAGAVYTTPAVAKVLFTTAERCIPGSTCTSSSPASYPDTPWDQSCTSTTSCSNKHFTPTFWTSKRLAKVTTQVYRSATARHEDVNSWTLTHSFPAPGDGTRAGMWLSSLQHTGHLGGTLSMPPVNFDGVQMPNRVDGTDDIPPMNWWRINRVRLETGGVLTVNYATKECVAPSSTGAGNLDPPDSNRKRCFPRKWTPDFLNDPMAKERQDWFNKYVVTKVTEGDVTTRVEAEETTIEYPEPPAWRFDEEDGMVPTDQKTWGQWRGYSKVITKEGRAGTVQSQTETRYFRGMHGDRTSTGTPKSVQVVDSTGRAWNDDNHLSGVQREQITYTAAGGTVLQRSITDPWQSAPTATRTRPWGTTKAVMVEEAKVRQGEVATGGGWRENGTDHVYDARGLLVQAQELNDVTDATDDTCTRYTYTSDGPGIVGLLARKQIAALSCASQPTSAEDVIAEERIFYDGSDTFGTAPTKGNITRKEEISGWAGGAPTYVTTTRAGYDAYGRQIEAIDVQNRKTTTSYTPASGPVTRMTVTNPLGHTSSTDLDPAIGEELVVTDANGRRTRGTYDPLGRMAKVWEPGRADNQSPTVEYGYVVRADGANVISTKTLQHDGTYQTEYDLYDGLMRLRQSQDPAPGGGRTIVDTVYNSRGLPVKVNGPYYNDGPVGPDLFVPDEALLPAQTVTEYDGDDQPIAEIFKVEGVEQWRSTFSHRTNGVGVEPPGVTRVDLTPPAGETATSRILDAEGRLVELRQYKGGTPTGAYDKTTYDYDRRGNLVSVVDPVGNTWRFAYDARGRMVRSEDPDRGITEYTFDDAEQMLTSRDARGIVLAYAYDELGRRTAVHEGSLTGPKRLGWTFDVIAGDPTAKAKGLPTSATRWVDGKAYTNAVTGYDDAGRPTGTSITIPALGGEASRLAGTYHFSTTFKQDGAVATASMPAAGGLPAETLTYGHDNLGSPTTLSGTTSYVTSTTYTKYGEIDELSLSAGGKWLKHKYDYEYGTRRLSSVQIKRETTAQLVANVSYGYDDAGNVLKIGDAPDPATGISAETQCFKQDYLRRTTDAWTPTSGDCAAAPSAAGLGGPSAYWHAWGFDATGNRTSETRTAADGSQTTSTYTYPAAGAAQPHTLRTVAATGPTGTTTNEYGYDATGNTTMRKRGGSTQSLEWDAEGYLSKVVEGNKTTSFVYDADGDRLLRTDPTGTTLYLGETEVRVDGNGVVTGTRYYGHAGKLVAVRVASAGGTKLTWLGVDHHGTPELAIDADTQSVQRRRYTPYGEERGAKPAGWPGEKSFVGGTADESTGLIHVGARQYDPGTGRFLSVDPMVDYEDPQQANGYAYANNNPATFSDPDGKFFGSVVHSFKTVVRTVVQPVVSTVKTVVHQTVSFVDKGVERVKQVAKEVTKKVVKKVKKHIKKVVKVVKKVTKAVKKAVKHVKKAAKKTWNATKKVAKKAAKKAWQGAKWVGRNAKPGGKIWNAVKIGLGVAAMFGCGVCLAASAGMSVVDAMIAGANGDGAGAAMELMAIVPGGRLAGGAARGARAGLAANTARSSFTSNSDTVLARMGTSWESTGRLARKAGEAEDKGFGHGVSVTADPARVAGANMSTATRGQLEAAGFTVRHTPTRNDKFHHTVDLPKPVTAAVQKAFNTAFGRSK
ncbi:RHS repeat domain-containing protein [Micromonospora polyrhachis]|uniref:RHS repeat-associated protein n=1 Tax=Micromonospora polyrhachis TaxID=1282883 RepID=A0A7W7WNK4_9ACTN|nr:RHS repeat-associated core domain-containing protein [Micromonospora polyrhachis]MBB4957722.1 RHS repeat-associated protein [Micromonospora polyrhachis]